MLRVLRSSKAARLLAAAFAAGLLAVACSGAGGGGADAEPIVRSLTGIGLKAVSTSGNISEPLLYVGGLLGDDENPRFLAQFLACRGGAPDSVFSLSSTAGGAYRSADEVTGELRAALAALSANGVSSAVVLGHNVGGLYARASLRADSAIGALPMKIKLITFYSPFAGLTPGDPANQSGELSTGSPFIESPGALAGNVEHFKVELGGSPQMLALTRSGPDPVRDTRQTQAAVDGDPQLRARTAPEMLSWPFSVVNRVEETFDLAKLGSGDRGLCSESVVEGGSSVGPAASTAVSQKETKGETAFGTQYDESEFAAKGLQSPNLRGTFDPSKPAVILVHGIDGTPETFDTLSDELSKTYNVFLFIYDESANAIPEFADTAENFHDQTDDLVDISEDLALAAKHLAATFGLTEVNFVSHSMGGVITRYSITHYLGGAPFIINFVSVASPFGGFGFANSNPLFWFSEITPIPGLFYGRMASGSSYINEPGTLPDTAQQYKIETLEQGQTFGGRPDDAVTLDQERNPVVDSDPNLVGIESVQLGHVEVLNDPAGIQAIESGLNQLRNPLGVTAPQPTPTPAESSVSSPTPAPSQISGPQPTSTPTPAPQPTATSTTAPTVTPTPEFGCGSGGYNPAGDAGCGLPQFALTNNGSSYLLSPFGSNGPVTFAVNTGGTGSASGLVIFNQPDHDCSITCAAAGSASVSCSNPRGGRCSQRFAN